MGAGVVDLIFVHVPKTAGISFLRTLHDVYGEENCKQVWDLFPYTLQHHGDYTHLIDSPFYQNRAGVRALAKDVFSRQIDARILYGHMPAWMYDTFFPGVPRVVWLRNPEDQVLSRIFHFRKHDILGARGVTPQEMAHHPLFKNNQFWYTGGWLSQFAFVGTVESYEEDLMSLSEKLGWGMVTPYHYHPTGYEEELREECKRDDSFMQYLRYANIHDFALYDYARGL